MAIVWNEKQQAYIELGSTVPLSNRRVLDYVNRAIEQGTNDLQTLAKKLSEGVITLESFIDQVSTVLKNMHLAQAIKAKGGEQLTKKDIEAVSSVLDQEFLNGVDPETGNKFGLIHLADDIVNGKVTEAQLLNRIGMYGESSRKSGTLVDFQDKKADPTYTHCLNILNKVKTNHHPLCIEVTAKGWVTLEEMEKLILPPRHARCACSLIYR